MDKQTVKDIDLKNKTVLVRADYNVPILEDGSVGDLYRVEASLPTVRYLLDQNCRVIIISHLGRPEGKPMAKYSLQPVATKLGELLGQSVDFMNNCIGPDIESKVESLEPRQVLLLENLRFHSEEEANDEGFAKELAKLGEVFVQDGFGVVHRAHASTEAITKLLPSVAGLLLEKEVNTIIEAMENPKRPLVAIMGGAKISDKIELIERFVDKADHILIGGAMANTFMQAIGYPIGKSVYEEGQEPVIGDILKKVAHKDGRDKYLEEKEIISTIDIAHKVISLPWEDVAVAKKIDKNERRVVVKSTDVKDDEYILDLGPESIQSFIELVKVAGTIIWNGPVGMTELTQFSYGSNYIAKAIKESKAKSIIGGGDTAAFVMKWDPEKGKSFDHISTGGGASLELMAGKKLPGVEALLDR